MLKVWTKLHKSFTWNILRIGVIIIVCSNVVVVVLLSKQIKTTIEIPLTATAGAIPQIINNLKQANASSRFAWNSVQEGEPEIYTTLRDFNIWENERYSYFVSYVNKNFMITLYCP